MGRPERQLSGEDTPLTEFAGRLRALRLAAGQPSYRRLAVLTHYSAATLARAAGGQSLPSLEVTLAYATGVRGRRARMAAGLGGGRGLDEVPVRRRRTPASRRGGPHP